jgi:biopolymer transport protein TolQ
MHLAVAHAAQSECAETERHLGILATIGSAAPFVGLLGTVWGILMTFQALGTAKSATIQVLGPPIAGALVATAAGLAVAIPAVVSYNWLSQRADTVNRGVRTFAEELERVIDLAPASGGSGQA